MRLFSRTTGGLFLVAAAALTAAIPKLARGTQPGPCPAPRAGVPRWNEAGPVNRNRNLRFTINLSGVPLVYDSERVSVATPYGGPGWALDIGTTQTTGSTVVIDDGGVRATFTQVGAAFQGELFERRTLIATGPNAYELGEDGGLVRVFAGGREIAQRDPHGVTRTLSYDGQGRLTQIADPRSGRTISLGYGATNRLETVTADGLVQTLSYDPWARLVSIGSATAGMPVPVAQVAYGGNGRISSTTNRAGETTSYSYADDGGLDTVRLPDSLSSRISCEVDDAQRLVMRMTDSFGDSVAQTHDAAGSVVASTDAYGNATMYARDGAQRVTAVTADGRTTQYTWSAAGDVTAVVADGRQTTYAYDAAHRVTQVTDALGRTSSYAYDSRGLPTRATDGLGRTTYWDRDAYGDVTQIRTPDGLATRFTRDAAGRTTSEVAPDGKTTSYAWTQAGDLAQVSYPDGTSESWSYLADGRVASHTDRRGQVSSVSYDAEHRATGMTLPNGRSIDVALDAAGRVTQRNLNLGPNAKSDAMTYGMYGEVASRSVNGIASQSAPRTQLPLPPVPGAGSGSGSGSGGIVITTDGSGSGSGPGSGISLPGL